MVFTVAKLEQPVFRDRPIAARCGTIQAHPLRVQIVDPDDALAERCLELLPLFRLGKGIQHDGQPIIAPVPLIYTCL